MSVQVDVNALFVELVAKENVACGETKQVVGTLNDWTIECSLYKPGNKERAKSGLTAFLQQAWNAENIKFFQEHSAPAHKFWCRFTSVDF